MQSVAAVSRETLDRLNETLARAVRLSPYYGAALGGIDTVLKSVDDLRRVPLLTRDTLLARPYDMLTAGSAPITVSLTGGTTAANGRGSRPVLTFHNEEEARARRAFLEASHAEIVPRPLLLHLLNLGHGYDTSIALEGAFQMALDRPFHFEAILSVLRQEFAFSGFTPRIVAIVGALRLLKALIRLCIERGIDGKEFDIGLVSTTSNHLTSRWRNLLGRYWNAEIDETYGLSEVPGLHAHRCMTCGRFHFSPLAIAEILRLDRDEPVEMGVGRVVATSLYPLASLQPIIRYDTGDVIEITGHCDAADTFGFEFLGRRADVVTLPGPEGPRFVLSPITVNEILDSLASDVADEPFAFTQSLGVQSVVGYQKWALQRPAGSSSLVLKVEMRRAMNAPEAKEWGRCVRERILTAAPALAAAVAAGELAFDVESYEPGTTNLKALF